MTNQFGLTTNERAVYSIMAGVIPGLGVSFLGLLGLAMAQNGRAAVDTAEYTQQMLKIARDQLKISKQALSDQPQLESPFKNASRPRDVSPSVSQYDTIGKPTGSNGYIEDPQSGASPVLYRDRSIKQRNGKYIFDGLTFKELAEARQYVDTRLEQQIGTPSSVTQRLR